METLGRHFGLGKSRVVTLAVLIAGLVQSRTVNLSHLAVHLPGAARPASKYRRLQRFFQFVWLDQEVAARLVVRMIVATNRPDPAQALNDYRKRWGIECLFGDAKTRGLNIEDTHITNPEKLASLIVIVMLAITWAYRCATKTMGMKAIPRKSHGRRQKSWFRIGLDALRDWIANQPAKAAHAWTENAPPSPLSPTKYS